MTARYGREDPWVQPAYGQAIAGPRGVRGGGDALYVELSPAGHCPHHEAPVATNALLGRWARALDEARAAAADTDAGEGERERNGAAADAAAAAARAAVEAALLPRGCGGGDGGGDGEEDAGEAFFEPLTETTVVARRVDGRPRGPREALTALLVGDGAE